MFLPPLGRNGKSDISYLVNGEGWRERDTEEMKPVTEKWPTGSARVTMGMIVNERKENKKRGKR